MRLGSRGRLLFEVQTSRLLFISALPQCGNYSRAATIQSADVAATIYPNVITTVAKPRVHVVILGCTIPAV